MNKECMYSNVLMASHHSLMVPEQHKMDKYSITQTDKTEKKKKYMDTNTDHFTPLMLRVPT